MTAGGFGTLSVKAYHYEEARIELINAKRQGKTIGPKPPA
jgi:hypothetical protein